jgi:pyridoxamine 5'-phosphate oxidase
MTDIKDLNPYSLFEDWFSLAKDKEPNDPNAMALATADAKGMPSVRMVLLKDWDESGFVFYTNLNSRKGHEIAENPQAALLFHWKSLRRQVRLVGKLTPVSDEQADAYFASRDRASQIGAWASIQSQPMEGRFELEKHIATFTAKFGLSKIPRPDHWSGFRLSPFEIEMWKDGAFRLHDRYNFTRETLEQDWVIEKLFP